MLKRWMNSGLGSLDRIGATISPGLWEESGTLISILFHSLFRTRSEALSGSFDPQQQVIQSQFRECIASLLAADYAFVGPAELEAGMEKGKKYAFLTFDDGYYNNTYALDALSEFRVPATFYIATNPVLHQKSFWWDVVYRAGRAAGWSERETARRRNALKGLRHDAIETALRADLGGKAFEPIGDADRPFTPAELKDFAKHPWVRIGNHTSDHAILTLYDEDGMARQIRGCQDALRDLLGSAPGSIAYPNGNFDARVLKAARAEGLRSGLTLLPHRNHPPFGEQPLLALGRFILWGDRDIVSQCAVFRSPLAPSHRLKTLLKGKGY